MIATQILLVNTIGNVYKTVSRISLLMLGWQSVRWHPKPVSATPNPPIKILLCTKLITIIINIISVISITIILLSLLSLFMIIKITVIHCFSLPHRVFFLQCPFSSWQVRREIELQKNLITKWSTHLKRFCTISDWLRLDLKKEQNIFQINIWLQFSFKFFRNCDLSLICSTNQELLMGFLDLNRSSLCYA